jgi:hypothetical protein
MPGQTLASMGLAALLLASPVACAKKPNPEVVGTWRCHELQPTPYEIMDFDLTVEPAGRFMVNADANGQLETGEFVFNFTGSGKLTTPKDQFIAIYKEITFHSASLDGVPYSDEDLAKFAQQTLDAVGYTFTIDRLTADELAMHDKTSHTVCARTEG